MRILWQCGWWLCSSWCDITSLANQLLSLQMNIMPPSWSRNLTRPLLSLPRWRHHVPLKHHELITQCIISSQKNEVSMLFPAPPPSAKVNNQWSYSTTPSHAPMACTRAKFPFILPNQKILNLPVVIFFQLEVDNSEMNDVWRQATCKSFHIPQLIIVGPFCYIFTECNSN
jgi:hypothetical protein